jgi:hypothetical protein
MKCAELGRKTGLALVDAGVASLEVARYLSRLVVALVERELSIFSSGGGYGERRSGETEENGNLGDAGEEHDEWM